MTPYTLTQLIACIDQSLAILSSQTFWVRAEIASLTRKNGHGYMELVEKAPNGQLAAKIRATCRDCGGCNSNSSDTSIKTREIAGGNWNLDRTNNNHKYFEQDHIQAEFEFFDLH